MSKVVAFLQARTDSSRLPRKVLKPLLNKPMIIHQLERVQRSQTIQDLVLLTSEEKSDNALAKEVLSHGFNVFRGSKNNVLDRFYKCAKKMELKDNDIIVRLTGDCPLHDASIIDELVNEFLKSKFDYIANCSTNTLYPDGFDAEVFTFKSLKRAFKEAKKPSEKEHVTPYMRNSNLFKISDLQGKKIHPEWRLTVDEADDFRVIEKIFNNFKSNKFSFLDIITFLEQNPDILNINSYIKRNEGYDKSLKEDQLSKEQVL